MIWAQPGRADAVLQGAIAVAKFAAQSPELDVRPQIRRELLTRYVLWLVTTGTVNHKYDTRFRTAGVLDADPAMKLIHEHVYTRKHLADLILANPTDHVIEWVLTNLAFGCTVTPDEHALLSQFDKSHQGWDRYREAGVAVYDMTTGDLVDFEVVEID